MALSKSPPSERARVRVRERVKKRLTDLGIAPRRHSPFLAAMAAGLLPILPGRGTEEAWEQMRPQLERDHPELFNPPEEANG